MDKSVVGAVLKASVPVSNGGLGDISPDLLSQDNTLHINLSKTYLNYRNEKVEILGEIDVGTFEYIQGYRYFGSGGCMFKMNGRSSSDDTNPLDLKHLLPVSDYPDYPFVSTHHVWVHPLHRDVNFLFKRFNTNTSKVEIGKQYLNRMGFVIEIIDSAPQPDIDHEAWFYLDKFAQHYDELGRHVSGTEAMSDIYYEIVNWDLFAKSVLAYNVTTQNSIDDDDDDMMGYDPTEQSRQVRLDEFYKSLLRSHELSKDLGIAFSFNIMPNSQNQI